MLMNFIQWRVETTDSKMIKKFSNQKREVTIVSVTRKQISLKGAITHDKFIKHRKGEFN